MAVAFLFHFLTTPSAMVKTAAAGTLSASSGEVVRPVAASVASPVASSVVPVVSALPAGLEPYKPPPDFLEALIKDYRPRLSAYIQSETKLVGKIEFYMPDGQHRRDVLSFDAIRELGWDIEVKEFGVLISKGDKVYPVTPWPFDMPGQVPQRVQQSGSITGQPEPYN